MKVHKRKAGTWGEALPSLFPRHRSSWSWRKVTCLKCLSKKPKRRNK